MISEVSVAEISAGPKVRYERIDLEHVARLRLAIGALPPIVIRQGPNGWTLVDGQHRLSAHKFEERETIRCEVVELDDAQALEAAVAANIAHGLHLTIAERTTAARRLADDTDWSDQRIATSCGLDRKTIAGLRPAVQHGETDKLDGNRRTGADGKARPATKADAQAQRDRIAEELAAKPDASLGDVAATSGASKSTVAKVRDDLAKIAAGAPDTAKPEAGTPSPEQGAPAAPDPAAARSLEGERAMVSSRARDMRRFLAIEPGRVARVIDPKDWATYLSLADELEQYAAELRAALTPQIGAVK